MELNLPEISLRKTHDLLNLVQTALQGICCSKFTDNELYVEALQKVLGNSSQRGPEIVFLMSILIQLRAFSRIERVMAGIYADLG